MEEIYTFTIKEKLLQRKYAIIKDKAFNPQVCLVNTFWTQRERNREFFYFFFIRNEEKYIKRRKDTREGRDTREREETREGWEVFPTKTKTEQKRKHSTLEN